MTIPYFSINAKAQAPTQIYESEWEDFGEELEEDADQEEWGEHHEELFELEDPNFRGFFSSVPKLTQKDYVNWRKHTDTIINALREGKNPLLLSGFVEGVLKDAPEENPHAFVNFNDAELRHAKEEMAEKIGGESGIRLLPVTGSVFRSIAPSTSIPQPNLSMLGYIVGTLLCLLVLFMFFFVIWIIRTQRNPSTEQS